MLAQMYVLRLDYEHVVNEKFMPNLLYFKNNNHAEAVCDQVCKICN